MAAFKSLFSSSSSLAAILLLLVALAAHTQMALSQPCSAELSNLNSCAPYVLPGATTTSPGSECCNALQGVDHNCLCNTIRIASLLPTQCNIPTVTCAA